MLFLPLDEPGFINTPSFEFIVNKKYCQPFIPGMRGLLQSIQSLVQLVDMVRKMWVLKTLRLFHINLFKKALLTYIWNNLIFKEHAIDNRIRINLRRAMGAKVSSKSVPSTYVYHCATNLVLFLVTWPSSSVFIFENPLCIDDLGVRRARDKLPNIISIKLFKLFTRSIDPRIIMQGIIDIFGFYKRNITQVTYLFSYLFSCLHWFSNCWK